MSEKNKEKNQLTEIYESLDTTLDKQMAALPQGFNKQRFLQNCMTVLQEEDKFKNCDARTVVRTLMKGAYLGLDFFNGECYAIPYGGKVQFQTDYKGEIKLAKKYSINPIKDIYAKVVREGDEFEDVIVDGRQSISFKPIPFNDNEIIGAFAVCLYKDGSLLYDTMSKKDIEATRKNYSKMPNGQAWKNSPGEMYKKTVLRRLCKLIDLEFETIEQTKAFEDGGDFEIKEEEKIEAVDPFIDAEYEEIKEEVPEIEIDESELPFK